MINGAITSMNPQCRCGSYMVFPHIEGDRFGSKCMNCNRVVYDQSHWTDLFKRLTFWKS